RLLGHIADVAEHSDVGHALPEDGDRPAVSLEKADEVTDQRRLAGTVGPEQAVDLAPADVNRHAVEGFEPTERLGDVVDLDRISLAHRLPPCGAIARSHACASSVTACSLSTSRPSTRSTAGGVIRWKKIEPAKDGSPSSGCICRMRPSAICVVM